MFLSSAGKSECPCRRVGRGSVAGWHLLRKEADCWAWAFSWRNVQYPTAISRWSCSAPADALCCVLGWGIAACQAWSAHPPSSYRGSCMQWQSPPAFTLGGCEDALAWPEPGPEQPDSPQCAATTVRLSPARLSRRFQALVWHRMRHSFPLSSHCFQGKKCLLCS